MLLRKSSYSARFGTQKKRRSFLFPLFIILAIAGGAAWFFFFESGTPKAIMHISTPYLGTDSTIELDVSDEKSGIKHLELTAIQGNKELIIYKKDNPRKGYKNPIGPREEKAKIAINGKKLGFTDGPVELRLVAIDFSFWRWFQGNKTVVTKKVTIDTEPPKIQILHFERYLTAGGTGFTIYKVSDPDASTSLQLNNKIFKSYSASEKNPDLYVNYYAVPYNEHSINKLAIIATDKAGNTTTIPLVTNFKVPSRVKDVINISDNFLDLKLPEFEQHYPELKGTPIEKFLYINSTVRQQNAQKITDICQNSTPTKLWEGRFIRMPGSGRAGFSEYRSYLYKGRVVDHQVHLGADIASVKQADVKAANNGVVVFAEYLGIYGKMIIIDHGQGVFSLYSHLSQINVSKGAKVSKGQVIAFTGTTGMAGGDHLHFSMLIQGIFVDPKEWWDKKWVQTTIKTPIEQMKSIQ